MKTTHTTFHTVHADCERSVSCEHWKLDRDLCETLNKIICPSRTRIIRPHVALADRVTPPNLYENTIFRRFPAVWHSFVHRPRTAFCSSPIALLARGFLRCKGERENECDRRVDRLLLAPSLGLLGNSSSVWASVDKGTGLLDIMLRGG